MDSAVSSLRKRANGSMVIQSSEAAKLSPVSNGIYGGGIDTDQQTLNSHKSFQYANAATVTLQQPFVVP